MAKHEPWKRGAYKRLGLHLAGPTPERRHSALGWAVIELRPHVLREGDVKGADPFAEAITMAHQAMTDGAEGIDLYRYRNEEVFARSRDAAEGATLESHNLRISMLAKRLRAEGIPVTILIVER